MSYLDHDGLAYFKSKLDRTFIADIEFDDGDIKLYGGDGTLLKTVVQEGTVTQKKSTTNKEYPILLCWDADAEEDQTMKTVWYGLDARINPKFGYLYARRYYTEHPSYERTEAPSARVEWHHIFTDAVSAPMSEVYEYLDRNSDGGEHRMELRLYGNPLSQYVDTPNHNEATDAVSLGVSATTGDKLTFFGYCPSTPIYEEDGETLRKSLVRGDQYGHDIITRDWLNLNGSFTGLVHTYMDETIDGYKTFLKTVTIDSGNDNAKAGLNVQGDVNIDSGDNTKPSNLYVQGNSHTHGNETVDGKLTVGGTAEISGGSGNTPSLKVNGDEVVTGKLTTEDLEVTDDLTVGDDTTIGGDLGVGGVINKIIDGNTTQEYVTYVTNQNDYRTIITGNLLKTGKGLAYDSDGRLYVDFSQIDDNTKAAIFAGLNIQIPLTADLELIVNKSAANRSDDQNLQYSTRIVTPFEHIQAAVTWATSKLALNTHFVTIKVVTGTYVESVRLPEVNASTGYIKICTYTGATDVTIESPIDTDGHYLNCIYANSGSCYYVLEQLTFKHWLGSTATTGLVTCAVGALVAGARISLYGCVFNVLTHPSLSNTITGATYQVRMIDADAGGQIDIFPYGSNAGSITANLPVTNTAGVTIAVLNASRDGRIYFRASKTGDHTISCSGSCTYFLYCWSSGGTNCRGSGNGINFTGTMTGYKYYITKGSYGVSYDANLPGTSGQEYVQESTYCWYSD